MHRLFAGLLALGMTAVLTGVIGASAATSASAATGCSTKWGSSQKASTEDFERGPYESLRTGRHACYDRLVLETAGTGSGFLIEYVNQVYRDGSGIRVPLRGRAKLRIILQADAASGFPTGSPELANVSGYMTFRQVAGAGWFEGQTTLGLGVRARLPFRAFTLPRDGGGTRLVIDVAHHW